MRCWCAANVSASEALLRASEEKSEPYYSWSPERDSPPQPYFPAAFFHLPAMPALGPETRARPPRSTSASARALGAGVGAGPCPEEAPGPGPNLPREAHRERPRRRRDPPRHITLLYPTISYHVMSYSTRRDIKRRDIAPAWP